MKLFQKLLVAPAALGLFAPLSVAASEANFNQVDNYSQVDVEISSDSFKPLSTKNPLLAGGEGLNQVQSNDFDGDTFSSTTSASFSADFAIGSVSGSANELVSAADSWSVELTTSFTGNDSLDVAIVAGDGSSNLAELDLDDTDTGSGDALTVDSISYTTQLGDKLTVFFGEGDGLDGGKLFNTACVYSGPTDTLDDCGIASANLASSNGTSFGASYDLGNGFAAAIGYTGQGNTKSGILTNEGLDAYAFNASYEGDSFGASFSFSDNELSADAGDEVTFASYGFSGYFSPDLVNFPSISAGFEQIHVDGDNVTSDIDDLSMWFLGLQWDELGNGTLGAAVGTKTPTVENSTEELMYEAFYAYNYADGITITPLIFIKESAAANTDDETGIMLKTSFSF